MDMTMWIVWMVAFCDVAASTLLMMHGWDPSRLATLFEDPYEPTDVSDLWIAGLVRAVAIPVAVLAYRAVLTKRQNFDEEDTVEEAETERDKLLGRAKAKQEDEDSKTSNEPYYITWTMYALQTIIFTGVLAKIAFLTCFKDLVSGGIFWRMCLVGQAALFIICEHFLTQHVFAGSSSNPPPTASSSKSEENGNRSYALHSKEEAQNGHHSNQKLGERRSLRTSMEHKRRLLSSVSAESLASFAQSEKEGAGAGIIEKVARVSQRKELRRLFAIAWLDWPFVILGFIFLLTAATCTTVLPKYTGQVIDNIVIDKSGDKVRDSLIILSIMTVAAGITSGGRACCFIILNVKLNVRIRDMAYRAILRQEIAFFDSQSTGKLTSRLSADVNTMADQIGLNINIFLRSVVQCVGLLVIMVLSQWQLTVVTFITVPFVVVVSKIYGHYYKQLSKSVQTVQADCNGLAEEMIASLRTVRSFGNEDREAADYREKLQHMMALGYRQAFASVFYTAFLVGSPLLVTVAVLYFGGHMVMQGAVKPGDLVSFVFYQQALSQAIGSIGDVFTGLMQAAGASEKVFNIIDRQPCQPPGGDLAPHRIEGVLTFDDVSFQYASRPDTWVLQNVSFSVEPGQVLALVGASGSGKSSCIALMQRFYEPCSGRILLDGRPIGAYSHDFLHSKLGLVGQEPVLYRRSIRDNIAYGYGAGQPEEEVDAAVVKAAKLASAHEFISELAEGYHTAAGERGGQLSGGQKQRIAIARALVRNPAVLLLDEATSALDTASEAEVQAAIDRSMQGRTVVVVAHRLSTVRKADTIVVMHKGRVVEVGGHEELMAMQGSYAGLVALQDRAAKPQ